MKEFSGEDLNNINRVVVEIANPLSKTTAGRLEIANQLLQMQLIKNVDQYFTVLNTGKLDPMIEGDQAELLNIRSENEEMISGGDVMAISTDQHRLHVQEHKSLLADPSLRRDPQLVQLVLEHIQEHINLLSGGADQRILQITGQEPLAPPAPPALEGGQPPQQGQAPEGENPPTEQLAAPLPTGVEAAQEVAQPNMPTPAAPFENMPTNPANTLPE